MEEEKATPPQNQNENPQKLENYPKIEEEPINKPEIAAKQEENTVKQEENPVKQEEIPAKQEEIPVKQEKWDPDPNPLPEEKRMNPSQLKDRGKKLVAEKKWVDAYRVYTTLLYNKKASEEDKSIGLSNRSFILYNLERYEDAKTDGLRCVKLRPGWAKGYMRAGNAFLALNEIGKAAAYFKGGVGKEGDDGYMRDKVNEIYLEMNAPNLVPKTNYYYPELVDFKKNYFSNSEKADEIVNQLMEKRDTVYNQSELEKVLEEIIQIIQKTWNWPNSADMFVEEEKFFWSNCCWKLEMDRRDRENERETLEKMKRNNEREEVKHSHRVINTIAQSVQPAYKYFVDLKACVNIYFENLIDNYYEKSPAFDYYYLDEVKNGELSWVLGRDLNAKNSPETFYRGGNNKKKGIDYYWKFYMSNAGSFINGAFGNIIDDLTRVGVHPFFTYQNPETKQSEQVNVITGTMMDAVVVKRFVNPTIYYKEKEGYFKMLRGKCLGQEFLRADCGHNICCLLTDKLVYGKRLYLLVDLTATQYDIFEYNAKGFPYYEKTMLGGDFKVEKNFFVGNCTHKIETYVEPMVKENKKFDYFPIKLWTELLTGVNTQIKTSIGYAFPKAEKEEGPEEKLRKLWGLGDDVEFKK